MMSLIIQRIKALITGYRRRTEVLTLEHLQHAFDVMDKSTGEDTTPPYKCPICNGSGRVSNGKYPKYDICLRCSGVGRVYDKTEKKYEWKENNKNV